MDPLSITASIIAVLTLSAEVVKYLNDAKEASSDSTRILVRQHYRHWLEAMSLMGKISEAIITITNMTVMANVVIYF